MAQFFLLRRRQAAEDLEGLGSRHDPEPVGSLLQDFLQGDVPLHDFQQVAPMAQSQPGESGRAALVLIEQQYTAALAGQCHRDIGQHGRPADAALAAYQGHAAHEVA